MGSGFANKTVVELVELDEFSGPALRIYSAFLDDDQKTLFDRFLEENGDLYPGEVQDIINKLEVIGSKTGLKGEWYRKFQGFTGGCYLFDQPDKKLRLYFALFAAGDTDFAILLGGGGFKPKSAEAFQDVPKLDEENNLLKKITEAIYTAMDRNEIGIDKEGFFTEFELKIEITI